MLTLCGFGAIIPVSTNRKFTMEIQKFNTLKYSQLLQTHQEIIDAIKTIDTDVMGGGINFVGTLECVKDELEKRDKFILGLTHTGDKSLEEFKNVMSNSPAHLEIVENEILFRSQKSKKVG